MIPSEKVHFMMELGGFLGCKTLYSTISRKKCQIVNFFDKFDSLCEEDYHLKWLVHANHMTGIRNHPIRVIMKHKTKCESRFKAAQLYYWFS